MLPLFQKIISLPRLPLNTIAEFKIEIKVSKKNTRILLKSELDFLADIISVIPNNKRNREYIRIQLEQDVFFSKKGTKIINNILDYLEKWLDVLMEAHLLKIRIEETWFNESKKMSDIQIIIPLTIQYLALSKELLANAMFIKNLETAQKIDYQQAEGHGIALLWSAVSYSLTFPKEEKMEEVDEKNKDHIEKVLKRLRNDDKLAEEKILQQATIEINQLKRLCELQNDFLQNTIIQKLESPKKNVMGKVISIFYDSNKTVEYDKFLNVHHKFSYHTDPEIIALQKKLVIVWRIRMILDNESCSKLRRIHSVHENLIELLHQSEVLPRSVLSQVISYAEPLKYINPMRLLYIQKTDIQISLSRLDSTIQLFEQVFSANKHYELPKYD